MFIRLGYSWILSYLCLSSKQKDMKAKSRISDLQNRLYPYRSILFLLFVIVIFHNSWLELLDKYIIPIVSQIPDNNIAIAACILALSAFTCYFNHKQLYKASYFISQTLLIEISALAIYLFLRYSSYYDFYGCWYIDYVLMSMAPFLLAELLRIFRVCKEKCQKQSVGNELSSNSFLIDTPCDDESLVKERGVYAEHLIQHIFGTFYSYKKNKSNSNPFTGNGAFVINIGEEYGYGKTSFFALLHKKLTESKKNQYISFSYQPWLCESENAMVTELFNRFREALSPYAPQINKNIANYIRILLDKSDNVFVHFFRTVFFQSSSMHEEREKLKDTIAGLSKPIIVFIDDVDRLQKEELLMLLNLVRDTADFQNVFYIIAADKEHLFNCLKDCNISNPAKYLKKIINYEFMLPANDGLVMTIIQQELNSILTKYIKDEDNLRRKKELNKIVNSIITYPNINYIFCNVRDVKRILNDYMLTLSIIKNNLEGDIDYKDLFLLIIIKMLCPNVYKSLRDNEDQYLCLSNDIYILKPEAQEDKELDKLIMTAAKTTNEEKVEYRTIGETLSNSQKTNEELVANALKNIFDNQRTIGDEIRIKYKESYFRYFTGQLKKNQLSSLESKEILCFDENKFQECVKVILNTNKANSFITRIEEWSKKWDKSQFSFVMKIYLFAKEDLPIEYAKDSHGLGKRDFENNVYYTHRIRYSQILYNLYQESSKNKCDDNDKESLHRFFLENDHYDFSAITLNTLHGLLPFELTIKYEDLLLWRRELIKQFINQNIKNNPIPFQDCILDIIPLLRGNIVDGPWEKEFANYLDNTPDYIKWFEKMVNYEERRISWNEKYMEQLNFTFRGNFEDLISNCSTSIQQNEKIKDLMNLIRCPYLEHENYENHPFLLYIKNKCEIKE